MSFISWLKKFNYDTFISCIILDLLLPMVPVAFEYIGQKNQINEKSISIFMAIYILCIGAQSKRRTIMWLSVIVGMFLSFYYGIIFKTKHIDTYSKFDDFRSSLLILTFFVFVFIFFLERVNKLSNKKNAR
jgi:hypothetical protein